MSVDWILEASARAQWVLDGMRVYLPGILPSDVAALDRTRAGRSVARHSRRRVIIVLTIVYMCSPFWFLRNGA